MRLGDASHRENQYGPCLPLSYLPPPSVALAWTPSQIPLSFVLSRPPPPPIFVFLVYFFVCLFFLFGGSFPVSSESEALIWEGSGNLLIHETDCLLLPLNIPPSLGTHINQPSPNFYPLSLIYFGDSNLRSGEGFSVAGLSFKFTLQITALPSLSIPNILLYGNGS